MRIFTQALDGTYGKPAVGVAARLARADRNGWTTVAAAETNRDGCIENWDVLYFERGLYRIVFDSDGYFARLGVAIAYPEVAVIFRIEPEPETHSFQVQVTLAPYSYSTYFGTLDDRPAR
jgi:5-hydroxyisourate hydrolase